VPVACVVQPDYNITVDVFKNASGWPDAVGLKRRAHGSWMPVTWRDFAAEVRAIAAAWCSNRDRQIMRSTLSCSTRLTSNDASRGMLRTYT
jgi:hypothetical protein